MSALLGNLFEIGFESDMGSPVSNMLDNDGFVIDSDSWTEQLAEQIARSQFDIKLTDSHWTCIRIVREYYKKWGSMPMVRRIREESKTSVEEFDNLFKWESSGARGVLCKIAGLPKLLCVSSGC